MAGYFRNFPKTSYKFANSSFEVSKVISNITLKTVILDKLSQDDPYVYYKYSIEDGERAEDVANFYYDDPFYVWLVYFANDIVDPYTQWPMTYENFSKYFRKKYASNAGSGTDPIAWGQNTLITDNIIHYKNEDTLDIISKDTYTRAQTFDSDFVAGDWTAVRYFDYELDLNEQKRNILLVNDRYKTTAYENLRRLINA